MDTVIFEFDRGIIRDLFYFSEPGICSAVLTMPYQFVVSFGAFADTYNFPSTRIELKSVAVLQDGTWRELRLTTSKANLRTQNESFYFEGNVSNQEIHLHLDDFRPWWSVDRIKLGYTKGYSNNGYHNGTIYYPPALVTAGLSVRRGVKGVLESSSWYAENSVQILNLEGELDDIATWGLFNRPARLYVGNKTEAMSSFHQLLASRIAAVPAASAESAEIRLQERKKYWSDKIGTATYSTSDWPNLPDKYVDKRIRLAFGQVEGIKCVPVDEYTWKICDVLDYSGIKEIEAVYKEGVAVSTATEDLAAATFTLSSEDADGYDDDITADVKGVVDGDGDMIANVLTIARELMRYYRGIEYISDNFDTTAWAALEAGAPDGALVIDGEELRDVLDLLALSARVTMFATRAGLISIVRADETKSVSDGIVRSHSIDGELAAEYDDEGVVTSLEIEHDSDHADDEPYVYLYDEQETDIYREYERRETGKFRVAIKSRTDVETWAEWAIEFFSSVPTYFGASVPMDDYVEWLFFDTLFLEVNHWGREWYGTVKALIESLELRLDDMMIGWRLRYIGTLESGYEPLAGESLEILTDEDGATLYTDPEVA